MLGLLWKTLPRTHAADILKLGAFATILAIMGALAWRGALPRTRAIAPGDWGISD
jgi:hypothetical protein